MFNKFVIIISLVLFINFSCEEAEEAVLCADASLELVNALNSFNEIIFPSILSKLKSNKSELAGKEMLIKRVNIIIKKLLLIIPNFFKKITH